MNRKATISQGDFEINLPLFFPSISSVKTNFTVLEYLKLIKASATKNFLISAYDIHNQNETSKLSIISLLQELKEKGISILMDSGNYESYWHKNREWNIDLYNDILKLELADINFSFDHQDIRRKKSTELIKIIIDNSLINQENSNSIISPIIHANQLDLETICKVVVKEIKPKLLAIPERLLGDGIIQRFNKLKEIRTALNDLGFYTPIHLMGTGSPFSLLLFIWAGADTFDGLEWCQTSIDSKSLQTYHFQLREIFDLDISSNNYSIMTLYKNLRFFMDFNEINQKSMENNCFQARLNAYFSTEFLSKLQSNAY